MPLDDTALTAQAAPVASDAGPATDTGEPDYDFQVPKNTAVERSSWTVDSSSASPLAVQGDGVGAQADEPMAVTQAAVHVDAQAAAVDPAVGQQQAPQAPESAVRESGPNVPSTDVADAKTSDEEEEDLAVLAAAAEAAEGRLSPAFYQNVGHDPSDTSAGLMGPGGPPMEAPPPRPTQVASQAIPASSTSAQECPEDSQDAQLYKDLDAIADQALLAPLSHPEAANDTAGSTATGDKLEGEFRHALICQQALLCLRVSVDGASSDTASASSCSLQLLSKLATCSQARALVDQTPPLMVGNRWGLPMTKCARRLSLSRWDWRYCSQTDSLRGQASVHRQSLCLTIWRQDTLTPPRNRSKL